MREIDAYISELQLRASYGSSAEIVDPWSPMLSNVERATMYFEILGRAYAGRYPIRSFFPQTESLVSEYTRGRLLTWFLLWKGTPVGTASIEFLRGGGLSLISSAELPHGSILPSGDVYRGEGRVSALMYRRILDVLERRRNRIQYIIGDVRLARTDTLTPGGARSQEVNARCGLAPRLLCVPMFRYLRHDGRETVEFFQVALKCLRMRSSEYLAWFVPTSLDRYGVALPEVLSAISPGSMVASLSDLSKAERRARPFRYRISREGSDQYTRLFLGGTASRAALASIVCDSMVGTRFVEIAVENSPESFDTIYALQDIGAVPLGAMPSLGKSKATIHFGLLNDTTVATASEIEFAPRYEGTPIEAISLRLHSIWKHLVEESAR